MNREELKSIFDALRNDPQHHLGLGDIRLTIAQQDAILDLFPFKDNPLPPAEGAVPDNAAEQNKRMREWFKERTGLDDTLLSIHMEQIDVMLKGVQQQPTAEGAEEILRKNCNTCYSRSTGEEEVWSSVSSVLIAMQDFATLHAQRIADKMVEEKWINVKDGLPEKDGKSSIYCLVNSKYDGIVVRPYNEYHKCWDAEDADDYYCDAIDGKITHWMPLPNPPIK